MPRPARPAHTIDEALAHMRIFEGKYTDETREASRRRIARELGELRWIQPGASPAAPSRAPLVRHERAAQDLHALCQGVISDAEAIGLIARLSDSCDADGALAFACLLGLAGEEEGAQFWWQFAAGAGNATGALCMHLLHLGRGEPRDAQYWAEQTAVLEDWPCQYTPVAHEVVDAAAPAVGVAVHIDVSDDIATVLETAVKDVIEDMNVDRIEHFGAIPQPSPQLAHRLEDLIGIGN
ncbi:hypothetical protein [Streptomyces antimycoticus]|uniref:hypothetical protein n=1 Tax=Streptomyces antimycoticus TaxID=68175 RepID=UPI0033F8FB9B|nr:hypothetical protein OG751_00095 [Streptomyces antimycoticus]WTA86855.1 hypothetical protein OG751_47690 [Streptomyces antimycoticus]